MKKAISKKTKRITLKSLDEKMAVMERVIQDQAISIRNLRAEVQFGNHQFSDLPRIRMLANEAYEEVNKIRRLVARKYQLDVDAGVAEFIAKQKRDVANAAAIAGDSEN